MKNSKTLRVLNKSLIIAIIIVIISFIIPIVPCKTASVATEPIYELGLCRLPNTIGGQSIELSTKYYGSTTDSLSGFLIHFVVIYALVTMILFAIRKKAAKILDLTNKK